MKTTRLKVCGTDITQTYERHSSARAAARAVAWRDATIIHLPGGGFDAIPRGQPLPCDAYIVGHKVIGRYRKVRD
jgi:hypothetical protein